MSAFRRSLSDRLWASRAIQGFQGFWHAVRQGSTASVMRDPRFSRVEKEDLDFFRGIVGESGIITDHTALQALNQCVGRFPDGQLLVNRYIKEVLDSLLYR
jgi:hypothetical protein